MVTLLETLLEAMLSDLTLGRLLGLPSGNWMDFGLEGSLAMCSGNPYGRYMRLELPQVGLQLLHQW